jgi:hypothetical protein
MMVAPEHRLTRSSVSNVAFAKQRLWNLLLIANRGSLTLFLVFKNAPDMRTMFAEQPRMRLFIQSSPDTADTRVRLSKSMCPPY